MRGKRSSGGIAANDRTTKEMVLDVTMLSLRAAEILIVARWFSAGGGREAEGRMAVGERSSVSGGAFAVLSERMIPVVVSIVNRLAIVPRTVCGARFGGQRVRTMEREQTRMSGLRTIVWSDGPG